MSVAPFIPYTYTKYINRLYEVRNKAVAPGKKKLINVGVGVGVGVNDPPEKFQTVSCKYFKFR